MIERDCWNHYKRRTKESWGPSAQFTLFNSYLQKNSTFFKPAHHLNPLFPRSQFKRRHNDVVFLRLLVLCRYFSYEHFYVIYCKFWELDTDHDFLIDKQNLIRYGNHALTYRIVDRIFSQVCLFLNKLRIINHDFVLVCLQKNPSSSDFYSVIVW